MRNKSIAYKNTYVNKYFINIHRKDRDNFSIWIKTEKGGERFPGQRKKDRPNSLSFIEPCEKSDCPLNLVGTETSGTSVHMARSTIDDCLDALHIGLPGSVGTTVGVRDLDAESHALAADIALSHSLHLQSIVGIRISRIFTDADNIIANFSRKSKPYYEKIFIFSITY